MEEHTAKTSTVSALKKKKILQGMVNVSLNIALCLVLYRLKCVNFKQNCILFFILFSVTTELLFVSLKWLKSLKRGRFTLVCSTV